ncbi:MAG: class I SAM-dependent DNA methyltransferase [Steroidobacteraceae bacterium]
MDEAHASLERARQCLRAADYDGAERLLRAAIEHEAALAAAYELLGKLLYRDGRAQEAAAVYRAWLQVIPSDPVAAHLCAATGGAPAPERASEGFIASVFGRAAPEYDTALSKLGYRAPQLLFERATEAFGSPAPPSGRPGPPSSRSAAFDVLDLGCGTGLCAEWFRPLAKRLVGVDLCLGMLEEARKRGCYDELVCEELAAYVRRCPDRFDLVIAADVFCYFGELESVFAAVRRLLRPDAWFIFSVEELDGWQAAHSGGTDAVRLMLLEHGRYAHGGAYVESTLRSAGFVVAGVHRDMLRFERGAPVQGLITVARSAIEGRPPNAFGAPGDGIA